MTDLTGDGLLERLTAWAGILDEDPAVGEPDGPRELWPVRTARGERFYLKRLGPWRNLPVANEYRMLLHLRAQGIVVPPFEVTDAGTVTAGAADDSFVLMPALEDHAIPAADIPALESRVGAATARLHRALATYRRPLLSYTENIAGGLTGQLRLPEVILERFAPERDRIISALAPLSLQPVHGDFTPGNVLRSADGGVAGFIDFDHLPMAPRIWDIAKYLSRRLRSGWRDETPAIDPLLCIRTFLAGYRSETDLRTEERDALPGAIVAYNVMEASYDRSAGLAA